LFIGVGSSVTAEGKLAVEFASIGSVGVHWSIITLLSSVNGTVSTRRKFAVASASAWDGVRVSQIPSSVPQESVITLLKGINDSISASTGFVLREAEENRAQELVGDSSGDDVVQNRDSRVAVDELNFKVRVNSVNSVLRGPVEVNSAQRWSVKSTSFSSGRDNGEVSSIVQEGWSLKDTICSREAVEDSSSIGTEWSSLDVDGRLILATAGSIGGVDEVPFAGRLVAPGERGEGVDLLTNQLTSIVEERHRASAASWSSISIITFLTSVSNTVTTERGTTAGSAGVGLPVGVAKHSHIASFSSFSNSVSARGGSGLAGLAYDALALSLDDSNVSIETILGISKVGKLEGGDRNRWGEDNILNCLGTRWSRQSSAVGINSLVGGEGKI
jgi:hypothetical protein